MKKIFFLLFTFSLFSQPKNNVWSLEDCINYALKNNISIQNSQLDSELANINKKDAFGSFLPSVNANSSHSWNIGLNQNITTGLLENQTTQFTSVGLNVSVDIFNGLQNQNKHRKAMLQVLGNSLQIKKMQEDIALNIANAFLQILFNKENIKIAETQLKNNQIQIQRTKVLFEVGQIPKGDLYDIEATIASDEQRLIVAKNNLFLSKMSLAQLLQLNSYLDFDISETIFIPETSSVSLLSAQDILDKAKETRIDLKISANNLVIAKKDIDIAKGAFYPRLQGFYSFSTRASYSPRVIGAEIDVQNPFVETGAFVQGTNQLVLQPNFNRIVGNPLSVLEQFDQFKGSNFGIQLSVPILNGFSIKNNVQRAKVNYKRTKNQDILANQDLERNIFTAYNDLQNASKLFESSKINLKAREEAFNYAKERYNIGLINSFDFNQQQTLLINAQSDVLKNKYDFIFKTKILEFYYGIQLYKN
jgi:outer membrane protein